MTVWQLEQKGIRITEIVSIIEIPDDDADEDDDDPSLLVPYEILVAEDETLSPKAMDMAEIRAGLRAPD